MRKFNYLRFYWVLALSATCSVAAFAENVAPPSAGTIPSATPSGVAPAPPKPAAAPTAKPTTAAKGKKASKPQKPMTYLQRVNAAISANPHGAALYQNRAAYYMTLHDYSKALADMNKAVALSENDPDFVASRAQLFLSTKDFQHAAQDFTTVLKSRPGDANIRYTRSTCYEALGQFDNALADLNLLLKTNPRIGYVYAERGKINFKQRNTTKALADFNAALFCNYQDADMLALMYKQYAKDGKAESALVPLNRLIALSHDGPAKTALYRQRLELYQKLDHSDPNLIASDLLKIADNEPQNTEVRYQFAESQWQRQPGLALQALDQAIKLEPTNGKFLTLRAQLAADHDQLDEAIADSSKALELDPRSAINFATRAKARFLGKRYAEAVGDANAALSLDPGLSETYYFKGAALQAMRQNPEALAAYNQYLGIKSRDTTHNDEDTQRIEEVQRRVKFVQGTIQASERETAAKAANEAANTKR